MGSLFGFEIIKNIKQRKEKKRIRKEHDRKVLIKLKFFDL